MYEHQAQDIVDDYLKQIQNTSIPLLIQDEI